MCIFAEGTTSNGQGLQKFKRGAFEGMRTVLPCFVKFNSSYFNPTYDTVPFWPTLIMYLSSIAFHHLRLTKMPEFTPTTWMLENQRQKGKQAWEIYAECVREAMMRHGNFFDEQHRIRDKLTYEDFMHGVTN